jgi:hypothetical protein
LVNQVGKAALENGHGVGKLRNTRFFSRYLDSKEGLDNARCSSRSKQLDGDKVMHRKYLVVSTSQSLPIEGKLDASLRTVLEE